MKIWNKIKYPLLIALVVLVLAFIRYLSIAIPSWMTGILPLFYPLIIIRLLSQDYSNSDIIFDVLFILMSLGAVMLVPCGEKRGKTRRYLLRPILAAVAVMLLSTTAINANDDWEDWYWDRKIDAYCAEVADFLDDADEIILHTANNKDYSPYFQDERIQCACGAYHSTIMIDYDTMRIAFLRHDWITNFYIYELKPGALTEENHNVQLDSLLPGSENRLITYYPDLDNRHRTCAMELIMADGTVYSTTDTPDEHWDNAFLEMAYTTGDDLFCVDQPHPKR